MESFFVKGYVRLHEPDLLSILDISDMELIDVEVNDDVEDVEPPPRTPEQLARFDAARDYLIEKYVRPLFSEFTFLSGNVWSGVDSGSAKFHNDSAEGQNCCFLVYFDDMSEEVGGALHVKYPGGVDTVYCQRGDVIWLNQQTKFLHKADRASVLRRLACFEFNVKGL
jgi:hypothetical protein